MNRWIPVFTPAACLIFSLLFATLPSVKAETDGLLQPVNRVCTLDEGTLEVIPVDGADPSEWHGLIRLPDRPVLWDPAGAAGALSTFRDAVREKLGGEVDAYSLIERQRNIFASMPEEWRGEADNSTLLLEGEAGSITPLNCIEVMLWTWQNSRFPMLEHPTEFGAFVLRYKGRIHIYLSSADMVGMRMRGEVTDRIRSDIGNGFRLVAHIHNHPFLFDREVGDRMWTMAETRDDVAGALAPSMTDVSFYRNLREDYGLEEAWITNGFETSRFPAGEFGTLTGR